MPLGTGKASTRDGANGTPYAKVATRDAGQGDIQATAIVSAKEDYAGASRAGITADDTATVDLSTAGFGSAGLADVGNCASVELTATCDTAAAQLAGRLVFYDSSSNPISLGELVTFTADATRKTAAAGVFVAQRYLQDLGRACLIKFYVQSLSGGTWTVNAKPL